MEKNESLLKQIMENTTGISRLYDAVYFILDRTGDFEIDRDARRKKFIASLMIACYETNMQPSGIEEILMAITNATEPKAYMAQESSKILSFYKEAIEVGCLTEKDLIFFLASVHNYNYPLINLLCKATIEILDDSKKTIYTHEEFLIWYIRNNEKVSSVLPQLYNIIINNEDKSMTLLRTIADKMDASQIIFLLKDLKNKEFSEKGTIIQHLIKELKSKLSEEEFFNSFSVFFTDEEKDKKILMILQNDYNGVVNKKFIETYDYENQDLICSLISNIENQSILTSYASSSFIGMKTFWFIINKIEDLEELAEFFIDEEAEMLKLFIYLRICEIMQNKNN